MRKLLLAAALLMPGRPAAASLTEPIVRYVMEVRLEPLAKTVSGEETLTWRNTTSRPTRELYFHLYYNAFKNSESTFFRELGEAKRRQREIREEGWGYCRVEAMALVKPDGSEVNLLPGFRYVAPDDGNEKDQTVARVSLPGPVGPGAAVTVKIRFTSKLPETIARSGFRRDTFFLAQWFPKLGVLEEEGWNCHQYHRATEYYADYGTYDVSIRVPAGYVVGATGALQSATEHPGETSTRRYYQEDVHDFAWTASPDYQVRTDRFQHPGLSPVDITLLLQPEHESQAGRYLVAVKHALRYFGEWYGAYPYPTLTVVDPARDSGDGGMEYPTLITGGTRWLAPAEWLDPDITAVHEAGHQFWYGLVANNEFEHAWLDEGFNTYSTGRVMDLAYGPDRSMKRYFEIPVVFRYSEVPSYLQNLLGYRPSAKLDALDRPGWKYRQRDSYGVNSYDKPALMLEMLHRFFGDGVWGRVMRTYFQRWRFRHPKPADFIAVVREVTGRDLSSFFDQVVFGSDVLDYGVESAESKPVEKGFGLYDREGRMVHLPKMDPPEKGAKRYRSSVLVRRFGEVRFPVEVLLRFKDGSEIRETWDGEYRWRRFDYPEGAELERVEVDPEHKLVLDINRTNNSWVAKPSRLGPLRWSNRFLFWLQNLLEIFAFFS